MRFVLSSIVIDWLIFMNNCTHRDRARVLIRFKACDINNGCLHALYWFVVLICPDRYRSGRQNYLRYTRYHSRKRQAKERKSASAETDLKILPLFHKRPAQKIFSAYFFHREVVFDGCFVWTWKSCSNIATEVGVYLYDSCLSGPQPWLHITRTFHK